MATIIAESDLPTALQSNELVALMVAGANAAASRVAPCLIWNGEEADKPAPSEDQVAEAKLVLVGAVSRWAEAGTGAVNQQSAGPFAISTDTTRPRTGYRLWPSEITDLQAICSSGPTDRSAWSIDTAPSTTSGLHLPWCDLMFGGTSCSCGVDIAGYPIYELG